MRVEGMLILCLASLAAADLRMASQPRHGYRLENQGTVPWNMTQSWTPPGQHWDRNANVELVLPGQMYYRYMTPSTFGYKGLEHQKRRNYDNFLRSNVDNEQDNRNFFDEDGKDHLPFRTMEAAVYNNHWRLVGHRRILQAPENTPVHKVVKPGESVMVPLRWNNPHSSEMEVNIWIFDHESEQPIVVPIRKPSCSGEGYQDNIVSFTVPEDFATLGAKIPGFKGCTQDSRPMCTLQLYSHSVESRTYAIGFPIMIPGHDESQETTNSNGIQKASEDPWLDLSGLRDTCLPATDPSATISTAVPRWARLVSDVFNHAYQNSDYSPYSGQQHEHISKNLQASAVNKMEVGNRGELGRTILTSAAYHRLRYLRRLESKVYKNYEAVANKIINTVGSKMVNTGQISAQQLATCFRCKEVGSTNTKRLQTNTYIPSFQLPTSLAADAKKVVPKGYERLITDSGLVQIYVTSMTDLLPFFYQSRHIGIIYQDAVVKSTTSTMLDATNFKKRDADGNKDGGKYAALEAKKKFVAERGCPSHCLFAKPNWPQGKSTVLLQENDGLENEASCNGNGVLFGDRFIQIGEWRIGDVDGIHFSIAHKDGKTATIYRSDGKVFGGPRSDFTTWPRNSGPRRGIAFGDRFIQIGEFRIGDVDGVHFSIAHKQSGRTAVIYRSDGRIFNGPRSDFHTNSRSVGEAGAISIGENFIQIGEWRIGDFDSVHFSVAHKSGNVAAIYKSDGTGQGGPRKDFSTLSRKAVKECKAVSKEDDLKLHDKDAWFCVSNLHKNYVKGPFPNVTSAKEELNKSPASRANLQMMCEMTAAGAKMDPSFVGGQLQSPPGFQSYWGRTRTLHKLLHQCNTNVACRLNVPADHVENPLVINSPATNVTGSCSPCVQFFGKKVHEMENPSMTPLASKVVKSGEKAELGNAMSKSDQPPENPDNFQGQEDSTPVSDRRRRSGRRRRRR